MPELEFESWISSEGKLVGVVHSDEVVRPAVVEFRTGLLRPALWPVSQPARNPTSNATCVPLYERQRRPKQIWRGEEDSDCQSPASRGKRVTFVEAG